VIVGYDTGIPPLTGTGTVFVTLLDVNDNAPEFADDYRPVVYENQPPSRSVITISAVDRDGPANGPPFEFWLPCHGACCDENPTCADFDFTFVPSERIEYLTTSKLTSCFLKISVVLKRPPDRMLAIPWRRLFLAAFGLNLVVVAVLHDRLL